MFAKGATAKSSQTKSASSAMPQTPVQALRRASFLRKQESHWIPAFAGMTQSKSRWLPPLIAQRADFLVGWGCSRRKPMREGWGYPPCLAGEESWNWSGKKLACFCKFCDTEFQKASRQLNIVRVTPGASASEGVVQTTTKSCIRSPKPQHTSATTI